MSFIAFAHASAMSETSSRPAIASLATVLDADIDPARRLRSAGEEAQR